MGEDDGQVKYAPNSADVMAACEWFKIVKEIDSTMARQFLRDASKLVDEWLASLDLGEAPR